VAAFGLAAAAGLGVDTVARHEVSRPRLLVMASLAFVPLVIWVVMDTSLLHSIGAVHYAWPVFGAMAVALFVFVLCLALPRSWTSIVLIVPVMTELVVLFPADDYAVRADPYLPPRWLQAVADDMNAHPNARIFGFDGLMFANIGGVFGLQDIRTIDALYPKRYFRYVKSFVQPQIKSRFEGTTATATEETTPPDFSGNPMFDLLGVRYLFSRAPRSGTGISELTYTDGVYVYANENALPRAFVVNEVTAVKDEDAAVRLMSAGGERFADRAATVSDFDPRRQAVVEVRPGAVSPSSCSSGEANVRITRYGEESVEVNVTSACSGLLVLTDTYFPGWGATVNGRSTPILATDLAFRGVPIRAGVSIVRFSYHPRSFRIGVGVMLATCAAFAAAAVASNWCRRRMVAP
jgi:hypothetical protein